MMCTVFALKMCFGFCNSRSNNNLMLQKIVVLKILGNPFSDVHGRGYFFIVIKFQAVVSMQFYLTLLYLGFSLCLKEGERRGKNYPLFPPTKISRESNMDLIYVKKVKERTDFD